MPISITENGWGNSCRLDVQQTKPVQEDSWGGGRDVPLPRARGHPLSAGVVEDVTLEVTR